MIESDNTGECQICWNQRYEYMLKQQKNKCH